jgi:hypothetical protein
MQAADDAVLMQKSSSFKNHSRTALVFSLNIIMSRVLAQE